MTLMTAGEPKKRVGRPKSKVTIAVEKAYADYEGKDAAFDVPRIVHQEHPEISLNQARKTYWKLYRQKKKKPKGG